MSIPKLAPVVVEGAFTAAQVDAMRASLVEARSLMDVQLYRASSIGIEALCRRGRLRPVETATTAFLNSRAHDFAVEQFPAGYRFLLRNCSFRKHEPGSVKSHPDLHFDANFIGLGGKANNVWVPLEDLGDGVPGLIFRSAEADPMILYKAWRANREALLAQRSAGSTVVDIFFDRADVRAAFGSLGDAVLMTRRIAAGGFIAIHQLVAHGTEVVAGVAKERGSIEFRIADPNALPDAYRTRHLSLAVVETGPAGRRDVRITIVGDDGAAP